MIRRFFRHLIESLKSLTRNGWMTVAAVSSVMITLSLVAVFASVILNTAKLANDISNNVRVMVYMRKDVFDNSETIVKEGQTVQNEDYHKVYDALTSMKNVEKVTFSSKQEQYNKRKIDGVSEVQNGGTNTKNLFAFSNFIQTWGLIGTALLIFIAILLISNTIRITIISRSREIQIMRLVGAKNSYIRGPFLFEGAWIGLLGATVPSLVVYLTYGIAYQTMNKSLVGQGLSMIDPKLFSPIMIAALFVLGILIGSLGSIISMRRFLKI